MSNLNKQDVQLVLDAWQKEMQAVSEQIEKLFRIFNYCGGPLPDSIDSLQEGYTRLLAEHIGFDFQVLLDWWLTHEFGERPMEIGFVGEELRTIESNRELAEWIVEFRERRMKLDSGGGEWFNLGSWTEKGEITWRNSRNKW